MAEENVKDAEKSLSSKAESLGMEKLAGIVEADESYFGGTNRKRNKKYRKPYVSRGRGTDKTPVFGIREREGNVFIDLLPNFSEPEIEGIIDEFIKYQIYN